MPRPSVLRCAACDLISCGVSTLATSALPQGHVPACGVLLVARLHPHSSSSLVHLRNFPQFQGKSDELLGLQIMLHSAVICTPGPQSVSCVKWCIKRDILN